MSSICRWWHLFPSLLNISLASISFIFLCRLLSSKMSNSCLCVRHTLGRPKLGVLLLTTERTLAPRNAPWTLVKCQFCHGLGLWPWRKGLYLCLLFCKNKGENSKHTNLLLYEYKRKTPCNNRLLFKSYCNVLVLLRDRRKEICLRGPDSQHFLVFPYIF